MNDTCLAAFEEKWPESSPKEKAQILSAFIMYVKRRYDVSNFRSNIDAKTKELEQIVNTLELKEFLPVSRAISYARKQVKDLGNTYGTGLKRRPTGTELRVAKSFKPIAVNHRTYPQPASDSSVGADDDL